MRKNVFNLFLLFFISFFISTKTVFAMCPICSIAVGAGVGFSRWLGVDDLITGLWIGALFVSMIEWTINWMNKKNIKFKFRLPVVILIYILMFLVPLFFTGIIGHLNPYFLFIDKLSTGIILGALVFWLVSIWYEHMKKKNNGHAYFSFQKVVMPIGALLIASFVIYLLIKF